MKIQNRFPGTAGSSAKQPAGETPGRPAAAGQPLSLVAGQILKGRVVSLEGDGKVLLEINQRLVTARSLIPLVPGSELLFEVKEGGASPWLALAGKKGAVQEVLRLLLGEAAGLARAANILGGGGGVGAAASAMALPPPLLALWEGIRSEATALAVTGEADVGKLGRLLAWLRPDEGSGRGNPLFPSSLGSRLAQVVDGFRALDEDGTLPAGDRPVVAGLDKMARLVEGMQELNRQPLIPGQPDFLLLPCFFAGDNGWGQWLFSMEDGGGGEEGAASGVIDFFLQMSRLGDLHLKILLKGGGLHGEFFVADEQVRSHLAAGLPQLTSLFEGYGFQPVSFSCLPARENLLQSLKQNLERRGQLKSFSLVDLTA
ncbi:MAG: flagellar hook-length control protein FliK [Desulfobulbaceae bacterium]|nr:flagellar hook-length control protein FliK [Desulfobulbaceae bacterium]